VRLTSEINNPRILIRSLFHTGLSDRTALWMIHAAMSAAGIRRPAATGEIGDEDNPRIREPADTKYSSMKKWFP
jgi:hypothetical protein